MLLPFNLHSVLLEAQQAGDGKLHGEVGLLIAASLVYELSHWLVERSVQSHGPLSLHPP